MARHIFTPSNIIALNSIADSLEQLLQKQDFADQCELWRIRQVPQGELADFYDGHL